MNIPVGAIGIWSGTIASIPSGWRLCDGQNSTPDLRSKFVKGCASGNAGSTGGASTHTHVIESGGSHNHGIESQSHSHTVQSSGAHTHGTEFDFFGASNVVSLSANTSAGAHTHTTSSSSHNHGGATSSDGSHNHGGSTSSSSNLPPYYNILFVQANAGATLPVGLIVIWVGLIANIPSGWALCDGTSPRPDLRTYFPRGADAGNNAGGTGGSVSHNHGGATNNDGSHFHTTSTDGSHNHTFGNDSTAHNHGSITYYKVGSSPAQSNASNNFTHQHGTSDTDGSHNHGSTNTYGNTNHGITSDGNVPVYYTVQFIYNVSDTTLPDGIIMMINGTTPVLGWYACDGSNGTPNLVKSYILGAAASIEAGQTGGVNSHNHGGSTGWDYGSHNHTVGSAGQHTHADTDSVGDHLHGNQNFSGGTGEENTCYTENSAGAHTHHYNSNENSHTHTIDYSYFLGHYHVLESSNSEPPYFTLLFIQSYSTPKTYSIDVDIKKFGVTKTYSLDVDVKKSNVMKTDSIDVDIKKYGLVQTYTADVHFYKSGVKLTYNFDVPIIKKNITKGYSIDCLFYATVANPSDIYLFQAYIPPDGVDDVRLRAQHQASTFTITYSIDASFKKLGVLKTDSIDVAFKKLGVTIGSSLDIAIQKKRILKTDSIDVLIKKLGVKMTDSIDVLFKMLGVKKTYSIDVDIQKLDVTNPYSIDIGFERLGVIEQVSVDAAFKKYGVLKIDSIDVAFQKLGIVLPYSFDADLKKLGLEKTDSIDALFKKYNITSIESIDVVFNKLNIPLTYKLDAILQATHLTTEELDTIFKKLGISPTYKTDIQFLKTVKDNYELDADLKKLGITFTNYIDFLLKMKDIKVTDSIDTVLKKLDISLTESLDSVLKKLGVTVTNSMDVSFKKYGITLETSLDVVFQKLNLTLDTHIDMLLIKLGITKEFSLDLLMKKLGVTEPYSIDVHFLATESETYEIDTILKKLGVTVTYPLDAIMISRRTKQCDTDVIFVKTVSVPYQLDVFILIKGALGYTIDTQLKKLGITKTDIVDALIAKTMYAPINEHILNRGFESESYPYATIPNWGQTGYVVPFNKSTNPVFVHSGDWSCQVGLKMLGTFYTGEVNQAFAPVQVSDIISFGFWVIAFAGIQTIDINVGYSDRAYQDSYTASVSSLDGWIYIDVLALIKSMGGRLSNHVNLIRIINPLGDTWQIFVDDVSLLTIGYGIDVSLMKYNITIIDLLDMIIKKIGIPKTFSLDSIMKKLGVNKPYSIDVALKALDVQAKYSIDITLEKLGISKDYALDVLIALMGKYMVYKIDVNLQKTITKDYLIDFLIAYPVSPYARGGGYRYKAYIGLQFFGKIKGDIAHYNSQKSKEIKGDIGFTVRQVNFIGSSSYVPYHFVVRIKGDIGERLEIDTPVLADIMIKIMLDQLKIEGKVKDRRKTLKDIMDLLDKI